MKLNFCTNANIGHSSNMLGLFLFSGVSVAMSQDRPNIFG